MHKARLPLIFILLLPGFSRPQEMKASADHSFEVYSESQPRQWSPLSDAVKSDIKYQIEKSGVLNGSRFSSDSREDQQEVLDALVQEYLGELRSKQRTGGGFLTGPGSKPLTRQDTEKYSFSTFVNARIGSLLGQDIGFIVIESKPPSAAVVVDGDERDATPTKLIASLGHHQVEVRGTGLHCTVPVSVTKNHTSSVICP